uniref:KRAB domain-containing protein n=1 Tax=Chelonoidis abingdonii TaxID=106734 RepID=A0A8C0HBV4_CHEAB
MMESQDCKRVPVSFEEVSVYFPMWQRALLEPTQRILYRDVLQENYESLWSPFQHLVRFFPGHLD